MQICIYIYACTCHDVRYLLMCIVKSVHARCILVTSQQRCRRQGKKKLAQIRIHYHGDMWCVHKHTHTVYSHAQQGVSPMSCIEFWRYPPPIFKFSLSHLWGAQGASAISGIEVGGYFLLLLLSLPFFLAGITLPWIKNATRTSDAVGHMEGEAGEDKGRGGLGHEDEMTLVHLAGIARARHDTRVSSNDTKHMDDLVGEDGKEQKARFGLLNAGMQMEAIEMKISSQNTTGAGAVKGDAFGVTTARTNSSRVHDMQMAESDAKISLQNSTGTGVVVGEKADDMGMGNVDAVDAVEVVVAAETGVELGLVKEDNTDTEGNGLAHTVETVGPSTGRRELLKAEIAGGTEVGGKGGDEEQVDDNQSFTSSMWDVVLDSFAVGGGRGNDEGGDARDNITPALAALRCVLYVCGRAYAYFTMHAYKCERVGSELSFTTNVVTDGKERSCGERY